jgi:hypothetical protein
MKGLVREADVTPRTELTHRARSSIFVGGATMPSASARASHRASKEVSEPRERIEFRGELARHVGLEPHRAQLPSEERPRSLSPPAEAEEEPEEPHGQADDVAGDPHPFQEPLQSSPSFSLCSMAM